MNNNLTKVVHIHTDPKFILGVKSFENENVFNLSIVFSEPLLNNDNTINNIYYCSTSIKDIDYVLKCCENAEIIVLWGLSPLNIFLTTKLPVSTKKVWRFFGAEIYRLYKSEFLSENSLRYDSPERQNSIVTFFSYLKSLFTGFVKIPKIEIFKVTSRIDYLMGLSQDEYTLLKSLIPSLPPFLQAPDWPISEHNFNPLNRNRVKIVIGISREIWNNYLDILEAIRNDNYLKCYSFEVLFSYGSENKYTRKVRKVVKDYPTIKLIENFMSNDELSSFLNNTKALVVNSYRQNGMGTIFAALRAGVKVYLNERNVMYKWLKNEGFIIFNIQDFFDSLRSNSLNYDPLIAQINSENFIRVSQKNSIEQFQNVLYKNYEKNFFK